MFDVYILRLSLLALLCLTAIITMVVVNLRGSRVPKRPDPPEEPRGHFTRPTAPANPSVLDHVHMRSGTIYEVRNPETEGVLPVRTELNRPSTDPTTQYFNRFRGTNGRSMAEISNSIHESLNASQARPGVVVRTISEKEALDRMKAKQPTKPKDPITPRKNRYHRDPVI